MCSCGRHEGVACCSGESFRKNLSINHILMANAERFGVLELTMFHGPRRVRSGWNFQLLVNKIVSSILI